MKIKRVPWNMLTKVLPTIDGEEIRVVDMKSQCGCGECYCTLAVFRDEEDQKNGTASVERCQHHDSNAEENNGHR